MALVQRDCNDCGKKYWYEPADGPKPRCNRCQKAADDYKDRLAAKKE